MPQSGTGISSVASTPASTVSRIPVPSGHVSSNLYRSNKFDHSDAQQHDSETRNHTQSSAQPWGSPESPSTQPPQPEDKAALIAELERTQQSITQALRQIDQNFFTAHEIVTNKIIPIVEKYGKESESIKNSLRFWKIFMEAGAYVNLETYEEDVAAEYDSQDELNKEYYNSTTVATKLPEGPSDSNNLHNNEQNDENEDNDDPALNGTPSRVRDDDPFVSPATSKKFQSQQRQMKLQKQNNQSGLSTPRFDEEDSANLDDLPAPPVLSAHLSQLEAKALKSAGKSNAIPKTPQGKVRGPQDEIMSTESSPFNSRIEDMDFNGSMRRSANRFSSTPHSILPPDNLPRSVLRHQVLDKNWHVVATPRSSKVRYQQTIDPIVRTPGLTPSARRAQRANFKSMAPPPPPKYSQQYLAQKYGSPSELDTPQPPVIQSNLEEMPDHDESEVLFEGRDFAQQKQQERFTSPISERQKAKGKGISKGLRNMDLSEDSPYQGAFTSHTTAGLPTSTPTAYLTQGYTRDTAILTTIPITSGADKTGANGNETPKQKPRKSWQPFMTPGKVKPSPPSPGMTPPEVTSTNFGNAAAAGPSSDATTRTPKTPQTRNFYGFFDSQINESDDEPPQIQSQYVLPENNLVRTPAKVAAQSMLTSTMQSVGGGSGGPSSNAVGVNDSPGFSSDSFTYPAQVIGDSSDSDDDDDDDGFGLLGGSDDD